MNKFDLIGDLNVNMQPIPTSYVGGMSFYESLSQLLDVVNNLINSNNLGADEILDLQQKKQNISDYLKDMTEKRKLDENGNFTGTWNGCEMHLSQEGLASDWNTAKGSYGSVSQRLNNSDTIINQNTNNISNAQNDIENIKGQKFIFIGDSYGDGYTPEGTVTSWADYTKTMLNIPNSDFYFYHHGGYGFNTNPGFANLLNNAITDISEKNKVKYIIVGGGYNDAWTYQNIATNMTNFSNICKTNFPNAKVIICPFGWVVEGLTTGVHETQKASNLINMVLEYQKNSIINGLCYVDGIYSCLHRDEFFSSDFVHPNNNGQYNIALSLTNYLKSNSFSTIEYMSNFNCFLHFLNESGVTMSIPCTASVDKNKTDIQLWEGYVQGTFNNVKLDGTDILLGTIRSATFNGINKGININCQVILQNGSSFYNVNATFKIKNNKFYVAITKLNSTGDNFDTLSFTKISLYNPSNPITIDSLLN